MFDRAERLLLLQSHDPHRPERGAYWYTPGGGLTGSETYEEAARRELREEVALTASSLAGPVWRSRVVFSFEGMTYAQEDRYFVVRVAAASLDLGAMEPHERRATLAVRWWTHAELAASTESIRPRGLAGLLTPILAGHLPASPIDLAGR